MVSIFDDMTQVCEAEVQRMLPLVDEQRRTEALRYKHLFGQFVCLKSWLMLKELLKPLDINDLKMDFNEHGKPFLVHNPEVHFNLSHCREAAICIIADHPVGIDIESIREFKPTLVDYTMNEEEVFRIYQAERSDIEFIKLWTQKEAVLKLSGEGISRDMKQVLHNPPASLTTVVSADFRYIYSYCY